MKKFLYKLSRFGIALLSGIILLLLISSFIGERIFNFDIPKQKNILVLGNSHPECAINDSILPNYFNLAQSGTAYFYDYLKARKIFATNPHIDTLLLGYSYNDISNEMDSWITGEDVIKYKIRNYFVLFNINDYLALLKANPVSVLLQTPQVIWYNIFTGLKGYSFLGGYKYLERAKLEEAKRRIKNQQPSILNGNFSVYQTEYLKNIYNLCKKNNVALILLNTPIHPLEEEYRAALKEKYHKFVYQNLKGTLLINDSNFHLPEKYFADLDHLNFQGAVEYSNFLKNSKLKIRSHENPMGNINKY